MSFKAWREVSLEQISNMKYGKMPKKDRIRDKGYPIYTGYKIAGFYDEYMFENPELLVVARGVGGTGDVKIAPPKSYITNLSIVLLLDELQADKRYLFYNLGNENLRMLDSGSAQSQITIADLKRYKITLPPIQEQKAIAKILSTLDQKIEVNNQINKTLENVAQAIFKQWFVDFEFPNEDRESYKSSGGEMVESELGMIPKGWEVKGLDEIAEFLNGLAMQKFRPAETEKAYPVLKIKELRQGRTDESSDLCSCNIDDKYIVRDGDIIFSWSGSLLVDIWCGGTCGLNQHLFKVTSDKFDEWFIYQWNKYHLDKFDRIAKSKATTMGHIKRKDLSDSKVLVPSSEIYLKAAQHQKYLFEKIKFLKVEMKRLEKIRDSLLPKLMSGEIRVPLDEEGAES
jgi:type I restriction enzyme S subunit